MQNRTPDQIYYNVLNVLEKLIDSAETKTEKLAIATKKRSWNALSSLKDGNIAIDSVLNHAPKDCYDETHALALAICLGKTDSVKKMLALFDKNNINNKDYFVWGYRQAYSLFHLAAHPHVHLVFLNEDHHFDNYIPSKFSNNETKYADAQIAIILQLATCGADINQTASHGHYDYAPFLAGDPMGHTFFSLEQKHRIRGALLLVGSNTAFDTNFSVDKWSLSNAVAEAGKQFFLMPEEQRNVVAPLINKQVSSQMINQLQNAANTLRSVMTITRNNSDSEEQAPYAFRMS